MILIRQHDEEELVDLFNRKDDKVRAPRMTAADYFLGENIFLIVWLAGV